MIELLGAFFTNSVAIASNAIHDLSDSFSLGLSWYLERYSNKKRDRLFSFGYKRFSLLSALINCLVLIFGSMLVLRETLPRLWEPQPVHTRGMIYLALLGIAFNSYAAFKLHHGHSHNEKILSLHFLEDVLGWAAVLIVAIAVKLGNYAFLDALLSLSIAVFVIWNAGKRLKITLPIFLQSIPENLNLDLVEKKIRAHAGVLDVHGTHVWSLDGNHHVLSTHIVIPENLELEAIKQLKIQIKQDLALFGIQDITLELEYRGEPCELCPC